MVHLHQAASFSGTKPRRVRGMFVAVLAAAGIAALVAYTEPVGQGSEGAPTALSRESWTDAITGIAAPILATVDPEPAIFRATVPDAAVGAGEAPATTADSGFRLSIPYRSQFDGSTFEWGNCGVSAIAMAMEYHGYSYPTHDVRLGVNQMTGNWDLQVGVDWRYLKLSLERYGFAVEGPYAARGGYLSWTLDDVLAHVEQGRPVMLMTHYRTLPGHEEDEWIGDHYILVVGYTADGDIVYHDPGFENDDGAYRVIDRALLERAWSNTWIGQDRTAMVIARPN